MSSCPYPGLRPFHRDEDDIFFGREEQVDELLERLDRSRFLAVVGPSGCGKSSLVIAGLIAALETGFLASAGARWRMATMRPGERPLARLTEALLLPTALGPERGEIATAKAFLRAQLDRGPLGLVEVLRETPPPDGTNLLLVVDQFEEIFRFAGQAGKDEAAAFVALLLATVRESLPIYIVLTMRSDHLGACALFHGLPEALNDSQYLTPRLTRTQLRKAIEGPAGVFGAKVHPTLTNRLLNDMGTDPDQLPLLQHVLMRIWMQASRREGINANTESHIPSLTRLADKADFTLSLEHYEAVGGLEEALSSHADKAFQSLDKKQQRIAEHLFRCLSSATEHTDTRRPTQLEEVAKVADVNPIQVASVAEVFRQPGRSFITPPDGTPLEPQTVLDISHESLIRQWRRLNGWVEREHHSATLYRRLEETARLWKNGDAALWRAPDLDIALDWQGRERPTSAWAKRYGDSFELTQKFLSRSRRRRQIMVLVLVMIPLLLLTLRGFYNHRQRAQDWVLNRAQVPNALLIQSLRAAKAANHERSALLALQARRVKDGTTEETRLKYPWWVLSEKTRTDLIASVVVVDDSTLMQGLDDALATPYFSLVREGHTNVVRTVAFSPDGRWLASGGGDNSVRLWSFSGRGKAILVGEPLPHSETVRAVAFSPDSKWLAVAGDDSKITFWTVSNLAKLGEIPAHHVASPVPTFGESKPIVGTNTAIRALAFDPQPGTGPFTLAAASKDNTLKLWRLPTNISAEGMANLDPLVLKHENEVHSVAFSDDGRWLASASWDHKVRLWGTNREGKPRVFEDHTGVVRSVAFHQTGEELWLASAGPLTADEPKRWGFVLRRFDRESCAPQSPDCQPSITKIEHGAEIRSLAFSPGGDKIVAGTTLGKVLAWSPDALDRGPQQLAHHWGWVFQIATAPADGPAAGFLASASNDKTIRLTFENNQHRSAATPYEAKGEVRAIAYRPGEHETTQLAIGDTAGYVHILEQKEGEEPTEQLLQPLGPVDEASNRAVQGLAFTPDGKQLAVASSDKSIRLWVPGNDPARLLYQAESGQGAVAIDPRGRWLTTGGDDGHLRLWQLAEDPTSQATEKAAPKLAFALNAAAFSRDGSWLAATAGGDANGMIRIWRVEELAKGSTASSLNVRFKDARGEKEISNTAYTSVAFNPQQDQLAAGSRDGVVRIWDLDRPNDPLELASPRPNRVASLSFDPAGRRIAVGYSDGVVLVWGLPAEDELTNAVVETASPQRTFTDHSGQVSAVAFDPNGKWLAAGGEDRTVRFWSTAPADRVCRNVGRNLTLEEWTRLVGSDLEYDCACPDLTCPNTPATEASPTADAD